MLNERAPIVERRVMTIKQPPWFNADLARLIMARDRLFDRTKHSKDPRTSAMYKSAKNHVNHEIRKAKRDFYLKSIEQTDTKSTRDMESHKIFNGYDARGSTETNQLSAASTRKHDRWPINSMNFLRTLHRSLILRPLCRIIQNCGNLSHVENRKTRLLNCKI